MNRSGLHHPNLLQSVGETEVHREKEIQAIFAYKTTIKASYFLNKSVISLEPCRWKLLLLLLSIFSHFVIQEKGLLDLRKIFQNTSFFTNNDIITIANFRVSVARAIFPFSVIASFIAMVLLLVPYRYYN
jgi:hypothetical protein